LTDCQSVAVLSLERPLLIYIAVHREILTWHTEIAQNSTGFL
jgi:hypothetical protein